MIQEAVYAIDRAAFNQGKNAKYNFSIDKGGGKAQTIVAKGPGAVMVKISEVDTVEQYAVDFGRTADRIQMNPTQAKTLLGLAGVGAAKTGLYHLKKEGDNMDYIVRRLTPVECERLQGLPDRFTDVECNGKPASDSARYKAIGNGMAQPCADFVLGQVVKALKS